MRTMRGPIVVALAAFLLMTACGGDDDPGSDNGHDAHDNGASSGDPSAVTVAVQADDYKFNVAPTLEAGPVEFTFQNVGEEPHEMNLFRLETEKPIEKILELPQKKGEALVEFVGHLHTKPGDEVKKPLAAELEPGRYAMVCFIPTDQGVPHFEKGMYAEITVE